MTEVFRRGIGKNLQPLAQEYPELFADVYCGAAIESGWVPLVREACEKMSGRPVLLVQIKEKFARLRIYFRVAEGVSYEETRDIQDFLNELETRSASVCERCGDPAEAPDMSRNRVFNWIKTLCPKCTQDRIDEAEAKAKSKQ